MITPPPLIDVKPGDPIISQQWNNILQAIRLLYDTLNKSSAAVSVAVKEKGTGNPIASATVTFVPAGEPPRPVRTGSFAGADVKRYLVDELRSGGYTVVIEAAGFGAETRSITVDEAGTSQSLEVELTPTEVIVTVPVLFGRAVNEAIDVATQAGLQVGRIIDSHGKDIPPGAVPDEVKLLPVLGQVPEPGAAVPKNTAIRLHVSAKAEFAARVKVPDLRGLTLEEAKAALEANQLVLGETRNVRR